MTALWLYGAGFGAAAVGLAMAHIARSRLWRCLAIALAWLCVLLQSVFWISFMAIIRQEYVGPNPFPLYIAIGVAVAGAWSIVLVRSSRRQNEIRDSLPKNYSNRKNSI
jgi:hypothetical protein